MKYRIRYRDLAKKDVLEIKSWLSQFYPGTPIRFIEALKNGCKNLEEHPYMYEAWHDNPAYRKMVIMSYIVFYKVDDNEKKVEIVRVLHGARNIRDYLK
jgi:addiction module RelE/StbE family toxin